VRYGRQIIIVMQIGLFARSSPDKDLAVPYAAVAQQQRQYNMCIINNIMTRRTKSVNTAIVYIYMYEDVVILNGYVYYIPFRGFVSWTQTRDGGARPTKLNRRSRLFSVVSARFSHGARGPSSRQPRDSGAATEEVLGIPKSNHRRFATVCHSRRRR